ncbi:hypothetical protein FisN_2Hu181 [Fistulifera solaris]|jgi:hypothetical protein|uniref:Uncharacterized protein n=1 Tax=Fistulifera solaris TaxID=1519565 RepID=A0A1Z5KKE9_FISSO|nr:hypothetical protein FisN_2Hu181 [Fistulifera solaris]|eukprot:GAX26398.1 hypothetical protein FisN_2Hu181 [Fistulifera solaris]
MASERWFEKIPVAELDDDKKLLRKQLNAANEGLKIQFCRKVRDPLNVEELLKGIKSNFVLWLNEESFIFSRKLPPSMPQSSKYRKVTTDITFLQKWICICGSSSEIVARSAAYLLCLRDEGARSVRVGQARIRSSDCPAPTSFLKARFLHHYLEANPQRRLVLGRSCCLSKDESVALALHPAPLSLGLECKFEDGGRSFVNALSQRTSDFGTLSLQGCIYSSQYYERNPSSFHFNR